MKVKKDRQDNRRETELFMALSFTGRQKQRRYFLWLSHTVIIHSMDHNLVLWLVKCLEHIHFAPKVNM